MNFHHEPVLLNEVLEFMDVGRGGVYMDGTLGGGGHSEAMLKAGKRITLYGIDRDPAAIEAAGERLKAFPNFHTISGNFHDARKLLEEKGVTRLSGALLDLGVSSHQLDTAERGFSYHEDAPLDMRMDTTCGVTAAQLLLAIDEKALTRVLLDYGEEKWAARIAKILVDKRAHKPIETTLDLVSVVDAAIPKAVRRKDDGHPARRTFQAIRIAVNDELDPLKKALEDIMSMMEAGGRLLVITFHSLEDRLVKHAFREMQNPCVCPPKAPICTCGKKPVARVIKGGAIAPTKEEIAKNPRARSAKLRVAERV